MYLNIFVYPRMCIFFHFRHVCLFCRRSVPDWRITTRQRQPNWCRRLSLCLFQKGKCTCMLCLASQPTCLIFFICHMSLLYEYFSPINMKLWFVKSVCTNGLKLILISRLLNVFYLICVTQCVSNDSRMHLIHVTLYVALAHIVTIILKRYAHMHYFQTYYLTLSCVHHNLFTRLCCMWYTPCTVIFIISEKKCTHAL